MVPMAMPPKTPNNQVRRFKQPSPIFDHSSNQPPLHLCGLPRTAIRALCPHLRHIWRDVGGLNLATAIAARWVVFGQFEFMTFPCTPVSTIKTLIPILTATKPPSKTIGTMVAAWVISNFKIPFDEPRRQNWCTSIDDDCASSQQQNFD